MQALPNKFRHQAAPLILALNRATALDKAIPPNLESVPNQLIPEVTNKALDGSIAITVLPANEY
jgi:hypothetical protein